MIRNRMHAHTCPQMVCGGGGGGGFVERDYSYRSYHEHTHKETLHFAATRAIACFRSHHHTPTLSIFRHRLLWMLKKIQFESALNPFHPIPTPRLVSFFVVIRINIYSSLYVVNIIGLTLSCLFEAKKVVGGSGPDTSKNTKSHPADKY